MIVRNGLERSVGFFHGLLFHDFFFHDFFFYNLFAIVAFFLYNFFLYNFFLFYNILYDVLSSRARVLSSLWVWASIVAAVAVGVALAVIKGGASHTTIATFLIWDARLKHTSAVGG